MKARGFSLLELIIVLSILILIIFISYPCITPLVKAIDTQSKILQTIHEINKNRDIVLNNGGEPITINGITYYIAQCSGGKFICNNKIVVLDRYYIINIKINRIKEKYYEK